MNGGLKMKRVLKAVGGFVAAMALACLLATSVQARTFYSFSFGFGGYYPYYCGPAYYPGYSYSGYCYPYAYRRPVYRYYYAPPVYYYSGGCFYRR
jgi:hypothetical protein